MYVLINSNFSLFVNMIWIYVYLHMIQQEAHVLKHDLVVGVLLPKKFKTEILLHNKDLFPLKIWHITYASCIGAWIAQYSCCKLGVIYDFGYLIIAIFVHVCMLYLYSWLTDRDAESVTTISTFLGNIFHLYLYSINQSLGLPIFKTESSFKICYWWKCKPNLVHNSMSISLWLYFMTH